MWDKQLIFYFSPTFSKASKISQVEKSVLPHGLMGRTCPPLWASTWMANIFFNVYLFGCILDHRAFLITQLVKNPPAFRRPQFNSWVGKIPLRRGPTPVFWPGEFQRVGHDWATFTSLLLSSLVGPHRIFRAWCRMFCCSAWTLVVVHSDLVAPWRVGS